MTPYVDPKIIETEDVPDDISFTLKQAFKVRSFWLMMFCLSIPSMVNTGLTFHMISILQQAGLNAVNASMILGIIALTAFPATFIAGFIFDKIKINIVIALVFAGQVLSMLYLTKVSGFQSALIFALMRGILQGFEALAGNIVWPEYFGRKHLGSIRGFIMIAFVIASALGPLPFGAAYDHFGSYTIIIYLMAAFPVLGSIAALLSKKPGASPIK